MVANIRLNVKWTPLTGQRGETWRDEARVFSFKFSFWRQFHRQNLKVLKQSYKLSIVAAYHFIRMFGVWGRKGCSQHSEQGSRDCLILKIPQPHIQGNYVCLHTVLAWQLLVRTFSLALKKKMIITISTFVQGQYTRTTTCLNPFLVFFSLYALPWFR